MAQQWTQLEGGAVDHSSAAFGPWSSRHLRRVLLFNAIGVFLIGISWYQTAGDGLVSTQLKWMNLAVAGLVVAGIGDYLWLLRGRHGIVWLGRTVMSHPVLSFVPVAGVLAGSDGASEVLLVSGSKMTRYHRAGCLLMAGKDVGVTSRTRHETAGLRACEVCEP